MLCERCGKRPATFHMVKIVNNKKTEAHLCEQCAQEQGEAGFAAEPSFGFQNILQALFEPGQASGGGLSPGSSMRCQNCGLTYSDFRRIGQLGCSECYDKFDEQLDSMLRRLHGAGQHTGKVPARSGGGGRLRRRLERLRDELKEAIRKEEYEKAAELRDKIHALEDELEAG